MTERPALASVYSFTGQVEIQEAVEVVSQIRDILMERHGLNPVPGMTSVGYAGTIIHNRSDDQLVSSHSYDQTDRFGKEGRVVDFLVIPPNKAIEKDFLNGSLRIVLTEHGFNIVNYESF